MEQENLLEEIIREDARKLFQAHWKGSEHLLSIRLLPRTKYLFKQYQEEHLACAIDTKEITRNDTSFIRVVAILLIVNSHLDAYYPISYLGTGTAIGNSLFFVLSSFGLSLVEKINAR